MIFGAVRVIVRMIRPAAVASCLFAGCMCLGRPAHSQAPPPTGIAPTPAEAKQRAAPTGTAAMTPAWSPTSGPAPTATVNPRRALCDSYIAALSGRSKDAALLRKREVRALAAQASDLVMCGAVVSDSDAPCRELIPVEHGPTMQCLHTRSIYHELRTYPKGRSFLFDEVDWDAFGFPALPTASREAFRKAMRSGDVKDCAQTGDLQSMCRAYIGLDESLCRVGGKLGQVEIELTGKQEKEKVKVGRELEARCKEVIKSRAFLAKGLKEIAESGLPPENEFAKAALGQPEACASFTQAVMDACLADVGATRASGRTPAGGRAPTPDQKR